MTTGSGHGFRARATQVLGGAGAHLDMPATAEKPWQACRKVERV
jgi:hypothetical protein